MASSANNDSITAPVILELFTSEGCSSCPRADKLLSEIARENPTHVALLSEHVDYWNYLGWKDPNSAKVFTSRQTDYCRRLALKSIYTPQLVIAGVGQCVGSDKGEAVNLLHRAQLHPPRLLHVKAQKAHGLRIIEIEVEVPETVPSTSTLSIAITEDGVSSNVKGGENSGRVLAHDGVTRVFSSWEVEELKLADKKFRAKLSIPNDVRREHLSCVAFLQGSEMGRVTHSAKVAVSD